MEVRCPECGIERAWKRDDSADPSDPSKCVSCRPIFYFDSFLQVNSIVFFSFGADRVVMIAGGMSCWFCFRSVCDRGNPTDINKFSVMLDKIWITACK